MNKNRIITLSFFVVLFASCKENYTTQDYLKTVFDKLNKIESASHYTIGENWNPGDTAASFTQNYFVKEYRNPSDTTIGSKFVTLDTLTKMRAEFCYDGQMRAILYNDEKGIIIDSFKVRPLPFRPIKPPFYNYVTSIIKYTLTTKDSITLEMQEMKNDIFVRLTINENEQVEFFGKAYHIPPSPYDYGGNTSIYEIWISKKSDLPYKVRREMSHNISVETCLKPEFNKLEINSFKASDYFPEDYEIRPYGYLKNDHKSSILLNKKASNWTLQSTNNQSISLSDFTSKVLMIQFTSISCGPCRASIPFLKELQKDYAVTDFDFVAIESTSNNLNALRNYMNRNQFNYKFLLANKKVLKDYFIGSYPVFLILDKNRMIKEIINGYGAGTTDNKIREVINKLKE
jgi:thiol-disulfide isomerase/thioredoxin